MSDAGALIDERVAFLYASQTGNAESISYAVYEEAAKRGFSASWHVLDDHEKFGFNSLRTIVFVVSTTGDGDPPDNSARFWRVLRKATRADAKAYSHLRFAILGLGDTNYSNFCNTAQRLDRQLLAAGATAFYPTGLADDGTGLEEVVEPWIEGLWPALARVARCSSTTSSDGDGAAGDTTAAVTDALAALDVSDGDSPPSAEGAEAAAAAYEFQPLLLDFRPMAALKAITGAPRVPPAVCAGSFLDDDAEGRYWAAAAQRDALACPPWHAELEAGSPQDRTLAPFLATIASATQITAPEALKRTLLVDVALPSAAASHVRGRWHAGDAFNIFAPNDARLVAGVLARLGVDARTAQRPMLLQNTDPAIELPAHLRRFSTTPASIQDMLAWSADLCSPPRKQLLRALVDGCAEAADRDRLLYLCSRQGTATFDELRRQQPTVLDILCAFPSCKPQPTRLLELLPPLPPRSYSICNAPSESDARWQIAFNVVEYELEVVDPFSRAEDPVLSAAATRIRRRGVCTPWLEELTRRAAPPHILVALRPNLNAFRLPPPLPTGAPDPRPVLMVGPGTGVAPFIGFLQQRACELAAMPADGSTPFTWLFFGCRSPAHDYLFRNETRAKLDAGVLGRLSVCFSRDPEARAKHGAERYVQDAMLQRRDEIADLMLNKNALLYVCGDAKGIGKDVNEAMSDILCGYLESRPEQARDLAAQLPVSKAPADPAPAPLTKAQALQLLTLWATRRRYLRDLWA
ncbi:hypothetical protein LPJ61_001586 [Coemansia biformis]|uniref:Methionine synthase reductase n=1 Tax=Coemansia biformis TaxID=1286918 RepID=A0A9W7YFP7_9FUNG|nr:hypothetical protein LPJ61_001586 [Coemansia biformis]